MDSKKGSEEYWKKCRAISEKENSWFTQVFIDFAPYPGRLKWRRWKVFSVIGKIKSKWRCRHFKHVQAEDLLKVVCIGTANSCRAAMFVEYPLKDVDDTCKEEVK